MERKVLLAKEHASSSIANEPSTNNSQRKVVDEQTMAYLVDVGYSVDEIKDCFDAISLSE